MREKGRPFTEGGGEGLPLEEAIHQERWAVHQKGEHLSRGGGVGFVEGEEQLLRERETVHRGRRRMFVKRGGRASVGGGEGSSGECLLGEKVCQERGCSSREENVRQERAVR